LYRRALSDALELRRHLLERQNYRCAITGLPLEDLMQVEIHHITAKCVVGNDDWCNLCLTLRWAHAALHARHGGDYSLASLKDVPFSGI
jgi:hypothetical protein